MKGRDGTYGVNQFGIALKWDMRCRVEVEVGRSIIRKRYAIIGLLVVVFPDIWIFGAVALGRIGVHCECDVAFRGWHQGTHISGTYIPGE